MSLQQLGQHFFNSNIKNMNPKKYFTVLFFSTLSLFITNQAAVAQMDQNLRKDILNVLQEYDSDSYYMITEWEKAPRVVRNEQGEWVVQYDEIGDWTEWIDGDCECNIISGLNLLVHETGHGYMGSMAFTYARANNISVDYNKRYELIYHAPDQQYLVEMNNTFPSREFADQIPDFMHNMGRYDTYISDYASEGQSTQSTGIYGILDEWNAYYLGTRTSLRLFDYFKNRGGSKSKNIQNFIQYFSESVYAYEEFKIYLLQYLIYAKQNRPDLYLSTLNSSGFSEAYIAIDRSWMMMIADYEKKEAEARQILVKEGKDLYKEGNMTWFGKRNTSKKGIGNFERQREMMKDILNSKEYVDMHYAIVMN